MHDIRKCFSSYDLLILDFPHDVIKDPHTPLYGTAMSTKGWKLEMWHSGNGYIIQRHTREGNIHMSVAKFLPHASFLRDLKLFDGLTTAEAEHVLTAFSECSDEKPVDLATLPKYSVYQKPKQKRCQVS